MFKNQIWISEPAYYADTLKYMNEINIKLLGENQLTFETLSHFQSFAIKLKLLRSYIEIK